MNFGTSGFTYRGAKSDSHPMTNTLTVYIM